MDCFAPVSFFKSLSEFKLRTTEVTFTFVNQIKSKRMVNLIETFCLLSFLCFKFFLSVCLSSKSYFYQCFYHHLLDSLWLLIISLILILKFLFSIRSHCTVVTKVQRTRAQSYKSFRRLFRRLTPLTWLS